MPNTNNWINLKQKASPSTVKSNESAQSGVYGESRGCQILRDIGPWFPRRTFCSRRLSSDSAEAEPALKRAKVDEDEDPVIVVLPKSLLGGNQGLKLELGRNANVQAFMPYAKDTNWNAIY